MKRPGKRGASRNWRQIARDLAAQVPLSALHPAVIERAQTMRTDAARERQSRWAVAFSGGADSLALLLLLWTWGGERERRRLVALHFNHRLRGRAADADERFCAEVCAALGVTLVAQRWNDPPAKPSEAAARTARHAFFAREMKRRRLCVLWLGHHQDDVAETMLMRLARGSGTGGLAAPRPVQNVGEHVRLRPLLTLRKAEIVAALRNAGAVWREDATNARADFFRNRVRLEVLPAWETAAGRDAVAGAALARERLEEDDAALEAWLDELRAVDECGRLFVDRLAGKPVALWRRALHRWLVRVRPKSDLSRQGFEQLLAAVRRGQATRFSLGREAFAVLHAGRLELRKA